MDILIWSSNELLHSKDSYKRESSSWILLLGILKYKVFPYYTSSLYIWKKLLSHNLWSTSDGLCRLFKKLVDILLNLLDFFSVSCPAYVYNHLTLKTLCSTITLVALCALILFIQKTTSSINAVFLRDTPSPTNLQHTECTGRVNDTAPVIQVELFIIHDTHVWTKWVLWVWEKFAAPFSNLKGIWAELN